MINFKMLIHSAYTLDRDLKIPRFEWILLLRGFLLLPFTRNMYLEDTISSSGAKRRLPSSELPATIPVQG